MLAAVYGGRTLLMMKQFEVKEWLEMVQLERASRAMLVPTMLKRIIDAPDFEKYDLSTIYSSQTDYGYKPQKMPGLAYYELGLMEIRKGNIELALPLFLSAVEYVPEYADAWTNLGLTYDHVKDYLKKVISFELRRKIKSKLRRLNKKKLSDSNLLKINPIIKKKLKEKYIEDIHKFEDLAGIN